MRFKVNFVKNLSCPVGIIAYISFVHFTEGQVPALEEPFPGSHGPELPKATPSPYRGCPAECNKRLSDAMALIEELTQRVTTLNVTVTSRLNNVPTGGSGANSNELSNRVINVENYLYGNMTTVTNRLSNDFALTRATLSKNITDTRNYLDGRINVLQASSGGGTTGGEVFSNITKRLDSLEFDKVKTLIEENNVWKKNFEVVNKTFSKLKKSSYSNEVIVVGSG